MPPLYFFHLKLELYPAPPASNEQRRFADHAIRPLYVPHQGCDIFKTALPAHRTSKWSSYIFGKRPDNLAAASTYGSASSQVLPSAPTDRSTGTHGERLLLPERSSNRRDLSLARPQPQQQSAAKLSNASAARDWRYGAVSIESIDMEAARRSGSPPTGLHTKAVYLPSDPKTTDVGWGVVHLYRDTDESIVLNDETQPRKSLDRPRDGNGQSSSFDPDNCTTLCVLAVPSYMSPSDLLGYVGDQAREDVSHFRMIRTGRTNKYMVLMKFRSAKKARDWHKGNNGRLFSPTEPENCHVVFIKSVEFLTPSSGGTSGGDDDGRNFPRNTNDPFTPVPTGLSTEGTAKNLTSKPLPPPPPNLLELPTCPVCLERMDETTGLLTILCQHVFHCACLEKWRGSGCPVCRYTHSPSYTFPFPRPSGDDGSAPENPEPLCSVCADANNLWVCLICGNLGCGRYDGAHAFAHYEATSHCYAMEISSQRVWDYAGDGYVHRLIQSKPDNSGKDERGAIHLPTSRHRHENEAFRAEGADMVPREKMESMATEYTYLLTSQLEGQRRYFEEQVARAADKAYSAGAKAETAAHDAEQAALALRTKDAEAAEVRANLDRAEKALDKSERLRGRFEALARDMSAQLREEKLMTEGLLQRIKVAEERVADAVREADKLRGEKADLEDANHDLTQFISARDKVLELQAQGEEVEEGGIGVVEKKGVGGGRKGKGKERKR